jgi:hypothetical protein
LKVVIFFILRVGISVAKVDIGKTSHMRVNYIFSCLAHLSKTLESISIENSIITVENNVEDGSELMGIGSSSGSNCGQSWVGNTSCGFFFSPCCFFKSVSAFF